MDVQELATWYQQMLLIAPRALIATVLVPAFAPKLMPRAARAGMALSLVMVAVLGPSGRDVTLPEPSLLILLFLKEAAVGICIGLAFGDRKSVV